MSRLRLLVLELLTARGISAVWRPWARGAVPVLMLHRFADPERNSPGFEASRLREQLALLRRRGYRVLPLLTVLDRLAAGETLSRTLVLTVDDGYADFARIALPVFEEFDCPVTLFVTTGFVDGTCWMWWDQVAWILERDGRAADAGARIETFKRLPELEKRAAIDGLARSTGVTIPAIAPDRYAPMTWAMVRDAAGRGVTFGAHTVTHPILARCDAALAEFEIIESWRRVQAECGDAAVPVFCYPNGGPEDQGRREALVLERAGLCAALTTIPGFVTRARMSTGDRFHLPRFAQPASTPHLLQLASGLGRLRRIGSNREGPWKLR